MSFLKKDSLDTTLRVNVILLCVFALLFGFLKLAGYLEELFALLASVLFITYLLLAPADFIESVLSPVFPKIFRKIPFLNPRFAAVLIVYLSFIFMLIITLARVVPVVSHQVGDFARELPSYYEGFQESLENISETTGKELIQEEVPLEKTSKVVIEGSKLEKSETEKVKKTLLDKKAPGGKTIEKTIEKTVVKKEAVTSPVTKTISQTETTTVVSEEPLSKGLFGEVILFFQSYASTAFKNIFQVATSSITGLIYALTSLVLIFYFLHDGKKLAKGFVDLMPPAFRETVELFMHRTHLLLFTFLKVQIILAILNGFFLFTIYTLYGIKFAGFLSVFFSIASILPVVGPWLGLVPSFLVILVNEGPFTLTIILLIVGVFFLLKDHWLVPQVLKITVDVPPIIVICTFLLCFNAVGVFGFLLAFPMACLACVIYRYLQRREFTETVSKIEQ